MRLSRPCFLLDSRRGPVRHAPRAPGRLLRLRRGAVFRAVVLVQGRAGPAPLRRCTALLGVSLSLALLALGQATNLAQAQLALGARTTIALVWVAASVALASRITGFEARAFARAIIGVLLRGRRHQLLRPAQRHGDRAADGAGVVGRHVHDCEREPSGWLAAVVPGRGRRPSATASSAPARMWRRDRIGAALAGRGRGRRSRRLHRGGVRGRRRPHAAVRRATRRCAVWVVPDGDGAVARVRRPRRAPGRGRAPLPRRVRRGVRVRVPHAARRHAHAGQPDRRWRPLGLAADDVVGKAAVGHAVVEPRPAAARPAEGRGRRRGARTAR